MTRSGRKMLTLCIGVSVTLCWLPRTQGQTSSGTAPTASARAPVAIVILSPHVVGPDENKALAAAELLCDQLAVELSKHAELRVVDRTQLDRLVTERKFSDDSGAASRPSAILAYDMMLRLRVDTGCPIPRTVLELIDLSDGNVVCRKEYLWSSSAPTTGPASRRIPPVNHRYCTSQPVGAPSSSGISVAIIEPEVLADLPADQRKALAGMVDVLLTQATSARKDVVLVDRQAIDKVLDEHKTASAGLADTMPGRRSHAAAGAGTSVIPEPLRPLRAAGILICCSIQPMDPKDNAAGMLIIVQAVAAQSGQLLAETYLTSSLNQGQWNVPDATESLQGLCAEALASLQRVSGLPLIEVSSGQAINESGRLQWIADDIVDSLRATVGAESGTALLTPRCPLSTKEERLLRAMGFSAAGKDDRAGALLAAPDLRIGLYIEEPSTPGASFDVVEFTITLKSMRRDGTGASQAISATVAKHEDASQAAKKWLMSQLKGLSAGHADTAADEEACRRLAQEEMSAINRLMKTYKTIQPISDIANGWYLSPLKQRLRAAIAGRAVRASHLDPTSEEAAYAAALTIDSTYFLRGQERSAAMWDRTILECQRYLDRFPGPTKLNNHRFEVFHKLGSACSGLADLRGPSGNWTDSPDKERAYRYASACLTAMSVSRRPTSSSHALTGPSSTSLPPERSSRANSSNTASASTT